MDSKNLTSKNDFSIADGLHTSSDRVQTFLIKVLNSDEAWVHLSGYINSQNSTIWSAGNIHTFRERSLHSLEVGV
jgi:hypothetical protein